MKRESGCRDMLRKRFKGSAGHGMIAKAARILSETERRVPVPSLFAGVYP